MKGMGILRIWNGNADDGSFAGMTSDLSVQFGGFFWHLAHCKLFKRLARVPQGISASNNKQTISSQLII